MMQNLPFLVTQNALTQNAPAKNAAQKPSESSVSFKDVLSKQTVSDAPKAPLKAHSAKQSQGAPQAQHAANAPKIEKEADETGDVNPNATTLPLAADLKRTEATDADENIAAATPQDANGLAMLPIQMMNTPIVPAQINTQTAQSPIVSTDEPMDAQKRLQLDMSLKTAFGTNTKTIASEDYDIKNAHTDSANQPANDGQIQSDVDHKWLDSVLKKTRQQVESGASGLSEKIGASKLNADKLGAEMGAQLMPEISAKLKNEHVVAIAPSAALQATARMDDAQMQVASSNFIQPSPGKAGWDQAISQKVVWMVGAEEQSATLTLNPPDLGPLQVVISVNNDKADTTFISENPDVRKALESGISTLRSLMDQAGVQLGQANVSTSQQQQDYQQATRERALQTSTSNSEAKTAETPVEKRAILRTKNGLVDTFA